VRKKRRTRFIISIVIIVVLVLLIYPLISQKPVIPCANDKSCTGSLQLKIENDSVGIFNNQKIVPPKIYLSQIDTRPNVLGTNTILGEKHIYVDLTTQTVYA
jgi:hypothetical protein